MSKMRNTWAIIADFVSVASSLEEAKRLVDEEMARGGIALLSRRTSGTGG